MVTKDDKLKFIMEAAGEDWNLDPTEQHPLHKAVCGPRNPSPDDMNKLVELAEKLGYRYKIIKYTDGVYCGLVKGADQIELASWTASQYDTPQEALLTALFVAKGGLEDESK